MFLARVVGCRKMGLGEAFANGTETPSTRFLCGVVGIDLVELENAISCISARFFSSISRLLNKPFWRPTWVGKSGCTQKEWSFVVYSSEYPSNREKNKLCCEKLDESEILCHYHRGVERRKNAGRLRNIGDAIQGQRATKSRNLCRIWFDALESIEVTDCYCCVTY